MRFFIKKNTESEQAIRCQLIDKRRLFYKGIRSVNIMRTGCRCTPTRWNPVLPKITWFKAVCQRWN